MPVVLAFALFALLCWPSCRPTPPPSPPTTAGQDAAPESLRTQALAKDPQAPDEALRDAINHLQDRFACNAISGCAAHAQLVGFGWQARPLVEAAFGRAGFQASWRARSVHIVAELADPASEPFLLRQLDDRDPEVRAWALYGLQRIDARHQRQRVLEQTTADTLWLAPAQLTALWVLHAWHEPNKAMQFQQILSSLAQQQMAATALVVAAYLCRQPHSPDCSAALPVMARHPNFQVRRDALLAMTARLRPQYVRALVYLTNDQARSLRQLASDGLVTLSGGHTATDHQDWQQWCSGGGCAAVEAGR